MPSWKELVIADRDCLRRGLQQQFAIERLAPASRQSWNAVFRGEGNGGTYFVKVLRPRMGRVNGGAGWGAVVAEALVRAGFVEVVAPLRNREREIVTRISDYHVLVYPWCTGRSLEGRGSASSVDAGRLLGRLHSALADLGPLTDESATAQGAEVSAFAWPPWIWATNAKELWSDVRRMCTPSWETRSRLQRAEAAGEELLESAAWFFAPDGAHQQAVHGDFGPSNTMSLRQGDLRVVDFDMCHHGRVEEDIAYAALSHSGPAWMLGPRDLGAMAAFISAYQSDRRRRGMEPIASQPLLVALRWWALKMLSLSFRPDQVAGRLSALASAYGVDHRTLKSA